MPPSREPWIKVRIGLRRSDKIARLPSDTARWGWVCILLEAKVQRHMGVFVSRRHIADVLPRYARFLDGYVEAGLAEIAPKLCDRCSEQYDGVGTGAIVVHDFRREQRDPTNADRQAGHREAMRNTARNTARNRGGNADHNGPRNTVSNAVVTRNGTADSRARGTTATVTTTRERRDTEAESQPQEILRGKPGERARDRDRAVPGIASSRQTNGDDRESRITRARATLVDPDSSPALRDVAEAELQRLGAPLETDGPDFGDGASP